MLFMAKGSTLPDRGVWKYSVGMGQSLMLGSSPLYAQPGYGVESGSEVFADPTTDLRDAYYYSETAGTVVNLVSPRTVVNPAVPANAFPQEPTYSYLHARCALDAIRQRRVVFNCAVGGATYAQIKKGTAPYAEWTDNLTAFTAWAAARGEKVEVDALLIMHGTANAAIASPTYQTNLNEWLVDVTADARTVTGQAAAPVMFIDLPKWGSLGDMVTAGSGIGWIVEQIRAAATANAGIYLVGPEYGRDRLDSDSVHWEKKAYFGQGWLFGEVAHKVLNLGVDWKPLQPATVVATTTTTITVTFDVPVSPIQYEGGAAPITGMRFNSTQARDDAFWGFSYDDAGAATIASVAINGANTILITLTAAAGATPILTYGHRIGSDQHYGNVQDSSNLKPYPGTRWPNWCVQFRQAVA